MKKIIRVFIMLAAIGMAADSYATQVLSVTIADLAQAEVIFRGTVTGSEKRLLPLPGGKGSIAVMTYTFSVPRDGLIKGNVPETFSFNQAIVKEVPAYEIGKEYTLCLSYESPWGLRTTIGLSQGKFNMTTTPDGKKKLMNDAGNKSLFKNLPVNQSLTKAVGDAGIVPDTPEAQGPLDYDKFVEIVKELNK